MVAASDFITIPYSPDMTQAGIKYACESLQYSYAHGRGDTYKRLRQIVSNKGADLAFTRHLNQIKLPHNFRSFTTFSDPSHYDITIGGRRCDIQSILFVDRKLIRLIHKEPHHLLQAQACIPRDQHIDTHHTDKDILIFAFITALVTPNLSTLMNAMSAGQPTFLIHVFPKKWAYTDPWNTLGELVLKSNDTNNLPLEIGGLEKKRKFETQHLTLRPKFPSIIPGNYYAINYFATTNLPDKTIEVRSVRHQEAYLIKPSAWKNIWVYGMQIFFCGYLTRDEFREKATLLPSGSGIFQYIRSKTENFSIPVHDLRPLNDLFERVRKWSENH